jgi:hypothetical protein
MVDLVARLVQRGPVYVIDGNNRFNAYLCSRAIARLLQPTEAQAPAPHSVVSSELARRESLGSALARVYVARAFTCYQMLTLLGETPASTKPTLVLDFLATFYDESVSTVEAQRLLKDCVVHLQRLSALAPVLASARPPRQQAGDRLALLGILEAAAHRTWRIEAYQAPSRQLSMQL